MRTLSAVKLAAKAEDWYKQLDVFRRCRHVYSESERKAGLVFRNPPPFRRFAAISFDFARQLSLPMRPQVEEGSPEGKTRTTASEQREQTTTEDRRGDRLGKPRHPCAAWATVGEGGR